MKSRAPEDFWKVNPPKVKICKECGDVYRIEKIPNRPPDRPPEACSMKCRERLLKKQGRKVG